MQLNGFIEYLDENGVLYKENEIMKKHTTFRIGGAADLFVSPRDAEELVGVLRVAKEKGVPAFILGNGSNILVSDKGIEGAVIDMSLIGGIEQSGDEITCGAGESLRRLCVFARDAELSGLEFAYGIPGTVGGAFYMNAGAYGGEIADVAVSAVCLDKDLNLVELKKADMKLGYRTSAFKTEGLIILSVKVKLQRRNRKEISAQMDEIFKRRCDKQPLDYPSAGSTFKRPVGNFAGTLIEQSGLKGRSVGGAEVSEKHAGFVINRGEATANDVLSLVEIIKHAVKEDSGVELNEEIIFIGRR